MNKLLSIIIPTKNRSYYCLYAVKQILSLNLPDVEICVQDNSDNDRLKNDLKTLNSPDVIYNYHSGVLSFVDNFNEAVSLANGDYLCMIGDDDGVLPDILRMVDDMKRQRADAAIPALNYIYYWPSNQGIVQNGEKGVLVSALSMEHKFKPGRMVNNKAAIKKLLRNGVQDYLCFNMPRLYHGIVSREALERIKKTVGCYFGGLTPDMYMATALSLVCKKVIRTNYSVTISGICPTSGSSDSATGKHTGTLSQAPHFKGHEKYKWEDLIPAFYSVDTIWADTLFHVLRDFERNDLISYYNKSLFSGICIKRYPEYSDLILKHALDNHCTKCFIKCSLLYYKVKTIVQRIIRKIKRMLSKGIGDGTIREYDMPDIIAATREIRKSLQYD